MLQVFDYENNDNVEMTQTFEYNKSFTDTISYGFKESIKADMKVSFDVDAIFFK